MRSLVPRRLVLALLVLGASPGCRPGDVLGNVGGGALASATGSRKVGDIARVALGSPMETVQQLNTQFTPEQEYGLGRAVAANALARYGLDPDETRQAYVRTVGQAVVALATRLRPTYGGYQFAVLDTDEVNGVSGPGGFVLVTRGAVKACKTEDELAAILCHEMAHVSLKHAEQILRQGPEFQSAIGRLTKIAAAAAGANDQGFASGKVAFLGEIAEAATKNATEHRYGGSAEFDADEEAVYLLHEVDYDASAMRDVLLAIAATPGRHGGASHAEPTERAQRLATITETYGGRTDPAGRAARAERFKP